jgi:hypothetical protein
LTRSRCKENAIKRKRFGSSASNSQMAVMGWIEAAAKETDTHDG